MQRSVSTAIIVIALVACGSLASAAAPRGYISRPCGFDLNFNGVPGEPGDCNRICRGGPTNADIDGNGVADRQVYVNCSAGTDSTTCGAPGSPCRTLQFAFNGSNSSFADRITTPAGTQIQAVCFQGVCPNATLSLTQSGAAGVYTRTATGSEPRNFEYPRYPIILSGWDVNADGNYPPASGETAVVDGNVSGNTASFFDNAAHSRYEMAHFTIRDYGQGCTGEVGIGSPGSGGGTPVDHAYWHDLSVIDVNRSCDQHNPADQSGQILWQIFTGTGAFSYFALQNISIQNWGGYIVRGSPGDGSGPFRFENITATALPANGSPVFGFKPWGVITGIDILDSVIDANTAAYSPGDPSSHFAIAVMQCVQDAVIRNNQLKDWKTSIELNPSASGFCSSRDIDKIVIDANEIRNTNLSWGKYSGHLGIILVSNDGSSSQVSQNVTITNNFMSSTNVGWRSGVFVENSRDSGAIAGLLRIAGNTVEANGASCDLGLIGFCTNGNDCRGQRQNNIQILGNILRGCQANADVVNVAYAPSGFATDWNVYDSTANWVWNGSTKATLAAWRTALGGCPAANHDCGARQCAPSYVSASSGNYHLQATDTCARDAGFSLAGILDTDIDGQHRPGGTSWDVGADEVVLNGTGPVAAPKLLDVEPASP